MNKNFSNDLKRFLLVLIGGFLLAINIVTFVRPANLIPGGFTGISLLIQNVFQKYLSLNVPYSVINYILNAIPVLLE